MDPKLFTVSFDEQKKIFFEPMLSEDQTIEIAMSQIFASILNLSSMFCGLILSFKLPEQYTILSDDREEIKTKPICNLILKRALKGYFESKVFDKHGLN